MIRSRLRFLHAIVRQAVWTALIILFCAGVGGAFAIGFSNVLTTGLTGSLATAGDAERFKALSDALTVAQFVSVLSLCAIALTLLCLAWFVRARLLTPIYNLRRSIEASVRSGSKRNSFWGVTRNDEIGVLARTLERWRASFEALASPEISPREESVAHAADRLAESASRLELRLAELAAESGAMRESLKGSCLQAALASKMAVEAAILVRDGVKQKLDRPKTDDEESRATYKSIIEACSRLSEVAERIESSVHTRHTAPNNEPLTLSGLLAELEALEHVAQRRADIDDKQATSITAGLVDAIDRINIIAENVSAAADRHLPASSVFRSYRANE